MRVCVSRPFWLVGIGNIFHGWKRAPHGVFLIFYVFPNKQVGPIHKSRRHSWASDPQEDMCASSEVRPTLLGILLAGWLAGQPALQSCQSLCYRVVLALKAIPIISNQKQQTYHVYHLDDIRVKRRDEQEETEPIHKRVNFSSHSPFLTMTDPIPGF